MDEKQNSWEVGRQRPYLPHPPDVRYGLANGSQLFSSLYDGFSVGSLVFAPKRRRGKPIHYALVEITGIQACSGTATVSFVGTEPGVDDEAVPLHSLIPCPRSIFDPTGSNTEGYNTGCSLLRRILSTSSQDSLEIGRMLEPFISCDSDHSSDIGDSPELPIGYSLPETRTLSSLYPVIADDIESGNARRIIHVKYTLPESADIFYARAFKAVCYTVGIRNPQGSYLQNQVVLCVFESYGVLHRFDVYMALRGHQVYLIDGITSSNNFLNNKIDFFKYGAQKFNLNVVWLCLLADDVEDEESTMDLLNGWLPLKQNEGNMSDKTLFSVSIVVFCESIGNISNNCEKFSNLEFIDTTDIAGERLLNVLSESNSVSLIKCQMFRDTKDDEIMATSLLADQQLNTVFRGQQCQYKVGEQYFKETGLELYIPISSLQLELIRLLTFRDKVEDLNVTITKMFKSELFVEGEPLLYNTSLSPTLLRAVAYGNLFDSSLSDALSSSKSGLQILHIIKRKVLQSRSFFGEEAFPSFTAIREIMEDILPKISSKNVSQQRRVALILSNVSNTTSESTAYLHAIQRFLYQWHFYNLTTAERQRPSVAALLDSISWLEIGGVILLSPEDSICRFGALIGEADFIIACGKAAATFASTCPGIPRVVLLSEVELLDTPTYSWTMWTGPCDKPSANNIEKEILKEIIAVGKTGAEGPPVMAVAAALLRKIGGNRVEKEKERKTQTQEKPRKREREEEGEWVEWRGLRRFAEALLLCALRAPAAFSSEEMS